MSNQNSVWAIEKDGNFCFQTKGEAIAVALEQGHSVGSIIYFGDRVDVDQSNYVDADAVLDGMADRAVDDVGESADDYPSVTTEAKQELDALLKSWVERNCIAHFWKVENVTDYVITEDDVKAAA